MHAPRLRLFTRFFVVDHVSRSVGALRRVYTAESALHPESKEYELAAKQVETFEKSLPTHRPRTMLVLLLLSVFCVSFLLARYAAPDMDPTLASLFREDEDAAGHTMRVSAEPLGKMTAASLTLSPRELADALQSFACVERRSGDSTVQACSAGRGVRNTVASLILLGLAVWIVTALPITSFRLKRMLFNVVPRGGDAGSEVVVEHTAKARGIYRTEVELFGRLGVKTPREVPFDLLSQAGLLVLPIWLSMLAVTFAASGILWMVEFEATREDATVLAGILVGASLLLTLALGRLLWLRRTYGWRLADAQRLVTAQASAMGDLSTWRRRLVAHAIDGVVVAVLALALGSGLWSLLGEESRPLLAAFLLLPLAWALYEAPLLFRREEHCGVSFGKQVAHVRVVRSTGERPGRARLFVRNVLLRSVLFGPVASAPLFLYPYEVPGFLLALLALPLVTCLVNSLLPIGANRHCALHDFISDTVVVSDVRVTQAVRTAPA